MRKRRSRAKPDSLPKGAYRVPDGDYVVEEPRGTSDEEKRIRVVAKYRAVLDVDKYVAAVMAVVGSHGEKSQAVESSSERRGSGRHRT